MKYLQFLSSKHRNFLFYKKKKSHLQASPWTPLDLQQHRAACYCRWIMLSFVLAKRQNKASDRKQSEWFTSRPTPNNSCKLQHYPSALLAKIARSWAPDNTHRQHHFWQGRRRQLSYYYFYIFTLTRFICITWLFINYCTTFFLSCYKCGKVKYLSPHDLSCHTAPPLVRRVVSSILQ